AAAVDVRLVGVLDGVAARDAHAAEAAVARALAVGHPDEPGAAAGAERTAAGDVRARRAPDVVTARDALAVDATHAVAVGVDRAREAVAAARAHRPAAVDRGLVLVLHPVRARRGRARAGVADEARAVVVVVAPRASVARR